MREVPERVSLAELEEGRQPCCTLSMGVTGQGTAGAPRTPALWTYTCGNGSLNAFRCGPRLPRGPPSQGPGWSTWPVESEVTDVCRVKPPRLWEFVM